MFDIFYSGKKPGLFAHEREASSIEHAQHLSHTRFFWWITYLADLSEWDFLWEPVPWQAHQRHAWCSQHQTDAGVYLVPATGYTETHYHIDRSITRLSTVDNWRIPAGIDQSSFDFSWHPDYTEPAYEYHFGTQWQSAGGPVYLGNRGIKLVHTQRARATQQYAHWNCPDHVNFDRVDYSWHPDPFAPPYIYHFPDQWQPASGVTYTVPGATEVKLIDPFVVITLPTNTHWSVPSNVVYDRLNYSWHPNPLDPPYIYHFPDQWQPASGVTYTVPGATEIKLVDAFQVKSLPNKDNWYIPDGVAAASVDYAWHPDAFAPPYIYHFPSQYQAASGVTYTVPGATEIKLIDAFCVKSLPNKDNWFIPDSVLKSSMDYSWHADPLDPPYIYHFPSQYQQASGVTYTVPGATEIKLVDAFQVTALPNKDNWLIPTNIKADSVDYSWHPNPLEPPYIYHFASNWQPASGVTYTVPGATEIKLIDAFQVKTLPNKDSWFIPDSVLKSSVDYSWHPNPLDPPYIYHFPSQYQPASGVTYTVPGATEIKLVDAFQVKTLPNKDNWSVPANIKADSVDYSWHPNPLDPPYIYHFPSQYQPASGTTYTVPGATEIKLVDAFCVKHLPNKDNWTVPPTVVESSVDYSWHPNPLDPAYIYHFPNQWAASSGVTYTVPGATEIKLVDAFCVKPLPDQTNWSVPSSVISASVDYSWQPDPLAPPYIYHFPDQWQPASSVTYIVPGATEAKLTNAFQVKSLPNKNNWSVPANIKADSVDYSWHPDPFAPPYIYHFPSQYQPASGVTYTVSGATEIKLVNVFQVKSVPNKDNWYIPDSVLKSSVDYSWHPNPLDPPYIYHFPNQWSASSGVTYTVPRANKIKLVDAFCVKPLPNKDNWAVPAYIATNSVDYSWLPDPFAPPYVYHFASQWQNASGVTYTVPGATEVKLTNAFKVRAEGNNAAWTNTDNIVYFDYSWHPDVLDPAYIYEFGTQWYDEGGPVYEVNGATDRKYVAEPKAQLRGTTENWHVLHPIDRKSFNWSWQPHPKDPAYIYVWGNNYWPAEKMPTVEYRVPGATERKYMAGTVKLAACLDNWEIPDPVSRDSVNYTWVPDPQDPPYIYEFATQWQHNGGARYIVPGATETKYIEQGHRRTPDSTHWTVPFPVELFDYSWHPDNTEEPYIYEFATQWQPNGGPVYHVPGAVKTKYIDIPAKRLDCNDNWQVLEPITGFDYSWHPDNTEEPYIYVFGNQHWPGTIMPTVRYVMPGATKEKFVAEPVARLAESRLNWAILEPIDETVWDWTWRPNPLDPPFIYVFGNQWNPAEYKASVRYVVPGATEVKYMELRTHRLPNPDAFEQRWPNMEFDWSWEPNPFDPPYTYVFGNQWNPAVIEPTVIYLCDGGTEYKYIDELVATLAPYPAAFEILDAIESFDYSWRPNPKDPPYLYVFGNQWLTPEQRPAVQYRVGTATEIKYMDEPKARRVADPELFVTCHACEFDYSWEPDPGSPPYIYVFGNQHWPAEIMPTIEYHVAGATERKFMAEPQARLNEHNLWTEIATVPFEFDRSWVPDPGDPAYVYVFGNQWHPAEEMSTIEYGMPGATERKFVDSIRARLLPAMDRWNIPEEINADNVDFSWHPHPKDEPYIHHFGSEYQMSIGLTYTVPGASELKFAGDPPLKTVEKKAVAVLDIFYLDRSNAMSASRFAQLQERYPHIQKVRFVNSIMDTIRRCLAKTKNQRFWVIGSENVYDDFDFAWHAQPWQSYMTHVFGSQWNKWSDTFLVNKWEFERNSKWATGIEQFPNLNFVQDQQVVAPADASPVYVLDHGNADFAYLQSRCRVVRSARYFDNYLDSLRRLLVGVEEDHIWVASSLCDYTRFDFSWQPEAWQRDMLHVFPSNEQKFGDTFYVPVRALQDKIDSIELLDWFETVNYCEDQRVPRYDMPVISHAQDSHIGVIKSHNFVAPLTLFSIGPVPKNIPTVSLWRDQSKTIVPIGSGAGVVIVPQAAIPYINTQMYDYPYIDKSHLTQHTLRPMDIVFISNGEPNADSNYLQMQLYLTNSSQYTNTVHVVSGVNGRVAAYQAAANLSTTPWFFAVFAKLEVDPKFDWTWQPDRMQQPKHYIFHALNPVNGLIYGHQAMIAYNKKMTLENTGNGLDFTLDQPHEVVPIISGTANYAESPWMAWRTAFREVLKLKHSLPDVENEYRLRMWLSNAGEVKNAEWSQFGAEDAVEYYNEVDGDFAALKKSYEWDWLATYAFMKRSLTPDR